ncbi:MAG: hypothetical protein ACLP62_15515 [Acidimicrobiales bacterium]
MITRPHGMTTVPTLPVVVAPDDSATTDDVKCPKGSTSLKVWEKMTVDPGSKCETDICWVSALPRRGDTDTLM